MASGIGGIGGASSNNTKGITQEDFLRILSTQLTFQDPLKPMDNQQFMAQMAQFSALEQTQQSNEKLDAMLSFLATSQSLGLIGKTVEITTDSNVTASGQVTTISFENGQAVLTVKTASGELLTGINPNQVSLVRAG
ncbi:flagellar hook capping protein [Neisseriaceae bacterium TC5R-5]|nr:flagellar hook capping protein [Neisseriaceae bacterium TC5R-5]